MLQDRINELNSGILNYVGDKVLVTGFMHENRVKSFLEKAFKNWSSIGHYNVEELTFKNIKSNALFIIQKDGIITEQQQFVPFLKENVQYKKKSGIIAITIRKNTFNNQFNLVTQNNSLIFESKEELEVYLKNEFVTEITF